MRHASAPQNFIQSCFACEANGATKADSRSEVFLFPFCRWTEGRCCQVCGFSLAELIWGHAHKREPQLKVKDSVQQELQTGTHAAKCARPFPSPQRYKAGIFCCFSPLHQTLKLWIFSCWHLQKWLNVCEGGVGQLWFSPACSFLIPCGTLHSFF